MPLTPGLRLGAYEIVALVGSGGMGEVYRARDTRLGRDVAIKVLAGAFSTDSDRLRRFEQESRAAAALNHPNILAVHDVGTGDAQGDGPRVPYVVSELLEGATLRERVHAGPLPVRKAIDAAIQIARGLAAAHEKGIVHRDLKPENIFVTEDGRIKILDFGLAKLTEREPALSGVSALPTTPPDTLPGVVLGTVGYMAPEQVRGRPTDHRSDIFSFGTILYEMLSGQRAFRGDTSADTMTAILKEDPPDLPAAQRHIPPALERIVDRCLEKNPAGRFQSAGDLAFALEALTAQSGTAEAVADQGARPKRRDRVAWTLVAVLSIALAGALGLAAAMYLRRAPADTPAISFFMSPPEGWNFATAGGGTGVSLAPFAVSRDGRRIAFIARSVEGKDALWVRSLDTLVAQMLPGTEGASSPFWSPDGRFLGFFAGAKLKKIDVSGGPAVTVCDAPNGVDGTWSRDGVILFAVISVEPTPLLKVSASGGLPTPATVLLKGEVKHVRPGFLPDGRHFVYRLLGTTMRGPVYLGSLDSSERTRLLDADSTNTIYSQGHLLFLRETTLMAQPFDMGKLALTGEPFPVAEPIQTVASAATSYALFSASETGVLAYQSGTASALPQLEWFDRTGKPLGVVGERAGYADLELSRDGKRAAVSLIDPAQTTRDIWIVDVARGLRSRLTFDPADEVTAIWSPDASGVVFNSRRKGHLDLYQKASNGAGSEELLLADAVDKSPMSVSPDGRFLLYVAASVATSNDLWVLPLTGDRKPFPFLNSKFSEGPGRFSPDGRWIAYVSNESGRLEVYVAPFPGPGGKWQISQLGGSAPRWRPDGKEIFYRDIADGRLMTAEVQPGTGTFEVGDVRALFAVVAAGQRSFYDVSPDGQRLLVNTAMSLQAGLVGRPMTVVVNWTAGLRR